MKKYLGVKIVEAEPMSRFDYLNLSEKSKSIISETYENEDGYKIINEDGYTTWLPKEVFEKAYRQTDGLSFRLAMEEFETYHAITPILHCNHPNAVPIYKRQFEVLYNEDAESKTQKKSYLSFMYEPNNIGKRFKRDFVLFLVVAAIIGVVWLARYLIELL